MSRRRPGGRQPIPVVNTVSMEEAGQQQQAETQEEAAPGMRGANRRSP